MTEHKSVTVSLNGDDFLTIETGCLSGREIGEPEEVAIRWAIVHLSGFIAGKRNANAIAAARAAGVREEREACAKIAEGSFPFDIDVWVQSTKKEMTALLGEAIAAAIRARANTGGENDAALQERESK